MNNGVNRDLCSEGSGLLWHPSDLMSTFDPTHTKALSGKKTLIECTVCRFATMIPILIRNVAPKTVRKIKKCIFKKEHSLTCFLQYHTIKYNLEQNLFVFNTSEMLAQS